MDETLTKAERAVVSAVVWPAPIVEIPDPSTGWAICDHCHQRVAVDRFGHWAHRVDTDDLRWWAWSCISLPFTAFATVDGGERPFGFVRLPELAEAS